MDSFAYVISVQHRGRSRDLAPTLLVRFAMSDVRSLLAVFVKRSVAGSRCSPRGAAWRLCKCCSWKRNRCLSPTPLASPLQSGYAYTLIPIASSAAMLRRILFRSSSGIPWKFRRARRDPSLLPRREEGANWKGNDRGVLPRNFVPKLRAWLCTR